MINKTKEITRYFRSAVASQANMGIDFKADTYHIIDSDQLIQGSINSATCKSIFSEAKKSISDDEGESNKKSIIHIIVCAKIIKTIFDASQRVQDEIDKLTGVFYIPAILDNKGKLLFDDADKKLPWFPREYLYPMIEPKLSIGYSDSVDSFISDHIGEIEKIKSWSDYATFFKEFYESVTESDFSENTIRNMDPKESFFELENDMYIFIDKTVYSTYNIMSLYNHLLNENQSNALYENFMSIQSPRIAPLIEDNLSNMKLHCGQMGGEYPLSPSQREAINHFNCMDDGEILAVNGPPGTGKTTLLQSIVADLYVKRAIAKEKPPIIVASSTNNQAVTNIIDSFGNIKKVGLSNLEDRWIEGVNSFATYFPSASKIKEAKSKGHQYTTQMGEFFVSDIEDKENIEKSKVKLIENCSEYFGNEFKDIASCQSKLHQELEFLENSKNSLLSLAQEASHYDLKGKTIDKYLDDLQEQLEEKQKAILMIRQRINGWENLYKNIPFRYKLLKFIKYFARKIQTEFRLFMTAGEQDFINEYMNLDEIKDKYSRLYAEHRAIFFGIKKWINDIEKIKNEYDGLLSELKQHNITIHEDKSKKYDLDINYINGLLDKTIRYTEFWLAVHYFECRWVNGEDELSDKQKGTSFANVLHKFYNRLSMVTPCLVMTFYMLPKQFLAFGDQKKFYLYDHIDLLIVDEAGQVSPEIAAGSFSLAKKSIVVGDIHQIEPVWSVNRALDKALALANGAIQSLGEFDLLEQAGLNCSSSSIMKVAGKCCRYEKFGEKGLFLSEHRRCYDEIIDYCNKLVYKGNLKPLRGNGKKDKKLALPLWPQMGFKQISTDYSSRKGSIRLNYREAEQIASWLENNFDIIINAYPEDSEENLLGIITPFKAQVRCIEEVLKRQLPNHRPKISVGTVHTFQGAERKIIILSTVYGKHDGCFFIDANKSLMNVAVSRAKDNFFVFGDINCLNDSNSSASGLLKKCIYKKAI